LRLRRDAIEANGRWVRGRYDLFGETREIGRSYASSRVSLENLEDPVDAENSNGRIFTTHTDPGVDDSVNNTSIRGTNLGMY
jgi:hypothetical protein